MPIGSERTAAFGTYEERSPALAGSIGAGREFGRTSVSGVSAAGDMARRAAPPGLRPAASVAAAGLVAAVALDQELHAEDTRLRSPLPKRAQLSSG